MSSAFHNFVLSMVSSEVHARDWCDLAAGSNKSKGIMALSNRIWLENSRGRHFSRIKLTYEISPRVVSENTAFRLIEKFIQCGYLKECTCHREAGAPGIEPTKKFLRDFEAFVTRMIRDHDQFGFAFKPDRAGREDFVIWSQRNGNIIDAVGTEKWLGASPKELVGGNLQTIFSDEWIESRGGPVALRKRMEESFDHMVVDGRHIVITPTCKNRATNSLVHTKVILNLTMRSQHKRGKSSEPIRRGAYEVIRNTVDS
jgi:hypothetical protein